MEDMWTTVFDIPASFFFYLLGDEKRARRGDTIPFILPNFSFQKQYFYFSKPIKTTGLDMTDPAVVLKIRNQTKTAIEQGIKTLFAIRERDPHRYISLVDYVVGRRHLVCSSVVDAVEKSVKKEA